jgi:hypothetical protein
MIEVLTRKYIIGVSIVVINKTYVWAIAEIKSRLAQEMAFWLMQYFEEKIKPAIKMRYGNSEEQYMLSCIDKFAYFLELLEFQ